MRPNHATASLNGHHENELLALIGPQERAGIEECAERIRLEADAVLHREDAQTDCLVFPITGVVANILILPDRTEVTTALTGDEGCVGWRPDSSSIRPSLRSVVYVPGDALRVPLEAWRVLTAGGGLSRSLFNSYNEACVSELYQVAACNLVHDAESRLCRWLLQLHDRVPRNVIPLTHASLARLTGIRRSTVTLTIGALQTAEILASHRGAIEVIDRFALEAAACECHEVTRRQWDDFTARFSEKAAAPDELPLSGVGGAYRLD